ncbi:SURF1 family protein [Alkalilacustris brevis]|uniref:SURF1 family protein n=1 Tax=Alkalilacustris brevis TaxID=2026338 RepID=UPI000E0D99C5|nr:SURF1 family protein [Alkalilacustris brevis]
MTRRMIWPLIFGVVGCAILISLGTWQVQRLHWKQEILAAMDARLGDDPVAIPDPVHPGRDRYLAVEVAGRFTGEDVLVMASERGIGAGYRVIAAFETAQGRRLLVDRGFIPADARGQPRPEAEAVIAGNLHWPEDADSFTPDPDRANRLWFARDVDAIATELGTEPALIVLRTTSEARPPARPVPLDTSTIPDNHLNYAITWFSLAIVWAGMTVFLLSRIRQRKA